ncbi:TetR/AcrR family transcriptional regulator [Mycobacterium sp. NPDC003449]
MARTVDPEMHAQRRAAIMAAAATEFGHNGFDGTSTAAICKRAGIGSGTLFHYFATKQEIVRAIFADDIPRLQELCARAAALPDPDQGLDLLIDHLLDELTDPLAPGLASAATIQANRDPDFAAVLTTLDDTIGGALTALLRRVAKLPGRSLPLPPASSSRWIRSLIDAGHLGIVDGPRDRTVKELRHIVGWLIGRHNDFQQQPR